MSQPTYRIKHAAQRLGIKPGQLRNRLRELGAITQEERAHPTWVREGWLKEEHRQFYHPVVGWKWQTRIDITEAGLVELWARIRRAA
ncbi:MAG: hypothetical protein MI745_09650 [Pseudomonadales bacterium]|nr:hypothetical protein [Pseudomonadales bacterium]